MHTLTAEPRLHPVCLAVRPGVMLAFDGMVLARLDVFRRSGPTLEFHALALFKTSSGKYVFESAVHARSTSGSVATGRRVLCFTSMADLRHYLILEHPMPSGLTNDLLWAAEQGDWPQPPALVLDHATSKPGGWLQ